MNRPIDILWLRAVERYEIMDNISTHDPPFKSGDIIICNIPNLNGPQYYLVIESYRNKIYTSGVGMVLWDFEHKEYISIGTSSRFWENTRLADGEP